MNFRNTVTFNSNRVMSDESSPSGRGGALFVPHGGEAVFGSTSDFTYNEVGRGGQGGAIANFGSVLFQGPSGQVTFADNAAPGDIETMGSMRSELA